MIHTLEFLNNVHSGCCGNVTVRLGLKWFRQVAPGDIVNIAETGKKPDAQARIYGVFASPMIGIPWDLLDLEHDESCRDYSGLLAGMKTAYPDAEINDDTVVTCLIYDIIDHEGDE